MHPQVAVIGGGIGGLGAALSLFRAGLDVQVYEQAHALREVGAGIQVSPNASQVHIIKGVGTTVARC
jgi:salicylate hydroxylase